MYGGLESIKRSIRVVGLRVPKAPGGYCSLVHHS